MRQSVIFTSLLFSITLNATNFFNDRLNIIFYPKLNLSWLKSEASQSGNMMLGFGANAGLEYISNPAVRLCIGYSQRGVNAIVLKAGGLDINAKVILDYFETIIEGRLKILTINRKIFLSILTGLNFGLVINRKALIGKTIDIDLTNRFKDVDIGVSFGPQISYLPHNKSSLFCETHLFWGLLNIDNTPSSLYSRTISIVVGFSYKL